MKCPNCGYLKARFVKQKKAIREKKLLVRKRKRLPRDKWVSKSKGQSFKKIPPREDFRAICPKCKYEWLEKGAGTLTRLVEGTIIEGLKKVSFYIFCPKKNEKIISDASCREFNPINPSEKARCWNCKFAKALED